MCDSLGQIVEKPQGCKDIHLKGAIWKKFRKAAVRYVHCKFQIALIRNQSLGFLSYFRSRYYYFVYILHSPVEDDPVIVGSMNNKEVSDTDLT